MPCTPDDSWPASQRSLLERLSELVERDQSGALDVEGRLDVERYLSAERFVAERDSVFRRIPLVVGHADEIDKPGDYITHDATGIPLVVVRGRDGVARAFKNTCTHRGTRLCREAKGHTGAFSCPYHAWTYTLDGTLKHVPHAHTFPTLNKADHNLVPVACEERHGLLWVTPGAKDVETPVRDHLAGVEDALDWYGLGTHKLARSGSLEATANWKVLVEAFLEAYHVRILHRRSVGQFFHDARSVGTWAGRHLLAMTARTTLGQPDGPSNLRDVATPSMLLFPSTVLVFQPDWIALLTIIPLAADRLRFEHRALVPAEGLSPEATERFERSWPLIHDQVFSQEDVWVAQEIQAGLQSGALSHTRIGGLDGDLLAFNAHVDDEVAR